MVKKLTSIQISPGNKTTYQGRPLHLGPNSGLLTEVLVYISIKNIQIKGCCQIFCAKLYQILTSEMDAYCQFIKKPTIRIGHFELGVY